MTSVNNCDSMDIRPKSVSLSCSILFWENDLIRFKEENDLSTDSGLPAATTAFFSSKVFWVKEHPNKLSTAFVVLYCCCNLLWRILSFPYSRLFFCWKTLQVFYCQLFDSEKESWCFKVVNLIYRFVTVDRATTGAGSWRQVDHACYLITQDDVNRNISSLDQIWLVNTEAGRYMVSLCYAVLGFHNFALIPSRAVKLQRLHTNV